MPQHTWPRGQLVVRQSVAASAPASVALPQAPALATRSPAAFARHGLLYVRPSQPQVCEKSPEQIVGRVMHVPTVPQPVPAQ